MIEQSVNIHPVTVAHSSSSSRSLSTTYQNETEWAAANAFNPDMPGKQISVR